MAWPPPVWLFSALSAIGALLGGLFGAYISKRGEIRAIHANLDKVLEQNRALTASAESIKQSISDQFWTKQRHWEMKKEVIFETTKEIGILDETLAALVTIKGAILEDSAKSLPEDHDRLAELWSQADASLSRARKQWQLTGIVCSQKTAKMVLEIVEASEGICNHDRGLEERYANLFPLLDKLRIALRQELGIDSDDVPLPLTTDTR